MKKTTWKKIVSILLVAALVIGGLQLNAKRVAAEDEADKIPGITGAGTAAEGSEGLNPAIVYSVERVAGSVSEKNPITIALVLDTSGSMRDTVAREVKDESDWTILEWGYYLLTGNKPTRAVSAMELALLEAQNFVDGLGDDISVEYVAFNSGVTPVDSLSEVSAHYNTGTNIDAAFEYVENDMSGISAIVLLTDGRPTFATHGNGGDLFGTGSTTTTEIIDETDDAVDRLNEKHISIYAINYGGEGNVFANNEKVSNYSADFDSESLKGELDKIATSLKDIYVTGAYIEAPLGTYVKYVGNAQTDKVTISADGRTLTWPIADYVEGGVKDPATAPLQFQVVVTDSEGNELTEQKDVVKALLALNDDPDTFDDQIKVEYEKDEDDNVIGVTIKIAVTAPGLTKLVYYIGTEKHEDAVTCTATETITVYSGPIPEDDPPTTAYYSVLYEYGDGEDAVEIASYSGTEAVGSTIAFKELEDEEVIVNDGYDKGDYYILEGQTLFGTAAIDAPPFVVKLGLAEKEPQTVKYTVNYVYTEDGKDVTVASYSDTAEVEATITFKALSDEKVIAAEGYNKADYKVVEGQELTAITSVNINEYTVKVEKIPAPDPDPVPGPDPDPVPGPEPEPEPEPAPQPPVNNTPSFILPPWQPTTTPTEDPTPEPTPVVEIEETETPEGAPEEEEPTPEPTAEPEEVEIEDNETPEGAPEEEIDIDEIETPEGDLPKTGVASTGVFVGIGAACIVIGGLAIFKTRRKEEM